MLVLLRVILLSTLVGASIPTPCVFVPSPACPVSVAANTTHSCFPLRLCTPGVADVNISVWHACKFAAHFREACQEYLVFDYLVHALRNRTAHPWLPSDSTSAACASGFSRDELMIPSCGVLRELYLCDGTRAALNASGLLAPLLAQCEPVLGNLTSTHDHITDYIAAHLQSDVLFPVVQLVFLTYFLVYIWDLRAGRRGA